MEMNLHHLEQKDKADGRRKIKNRGGYYIFYIFLFYIYKIIWFFCLYIIRQRQWLHKRVSM